MSKICFFYKKIFALVLVTLLASCYSVKVDYNEKFQEMYGEESAQILGMRGDELADSTDPLPVKLPNKATDINQAGDRSLPDNMFEVFYQTELYPPFTIAGAEFDQIDIPYADAYGIESTLSDKKYILAGNENLQRNIDKLILSQNIDDIEYSKTLIKEKKQLKQERKMAKIFADDKSKIGGKEEEEEDNTKLTKKDEDPLKKVIALQVIQQNLDRAVANNNATKDAANKK